MKRLFQQDAAHNAYHEGARAKPLIQAPAMKAIKEQVPIGLQRTDDLLFAQSL